MSELMDKAIDVLRQVPSEHQDDVARAVIHLARQERAVYHLTPEEEVELDEADAEIERGELATEADMRALWVKHGL